MKTGILSFLLAASLGANLLLLLRPAAAPAPRPDSAPKPPVLNSGGDASGLLSPPQIERLDAARTAEDFKGVFAELRAAGLPERMVQHLIRGAVADEAARRRQAIFDHAAVPYWRDPNPTPEQSRALRAVDREVWTLLDNIGIPRSRMDQGMRERRYGGLPDAKAAALEKILQDYSGLVDEHSSARTDGRMEEWLAQGKFLREEEQRDIDALLTPAEKLEWEVRTSMAADNVRRLTRGVEITEEEFRALHAAQQAFLHVIRGVRRTVDQQDSALTAWEVQEAEQRRVLGDQRHRQVLLDSSEYIGDRAVRILRSSPELGADQVAGFMRLSRRLSLDLHRATGGSDLPPAERQARATAVQARYRDELTQLLGAERAQEFIAAGALPDLNRTYGPPASTGRPPGGG
jgi:hypothetical protein